MLDPPDLGGLAGAIFPRGHLRWWAGYRSIVGSGYPDRYSPPVRESRNAVDKKQKKRLDIINKKLTNLRQQLSGSRQQADDLDELKDLENEIAKLEAEAAEIKASK